MYNYYREFSQALLLLFALLTAIPAYTQTSKVTGIVRDSLDKLPLPGVSVINSTKGNGAVTDIDGKYAIAAAIGDSLEFRYIGYLNLKVAVKGNSLDLLLSTDSKSLNEVVVTALGIKKEKKALGYSVQEVKGQDLVKARESNAVSSLTGKVAGLTVTPSTNLFGDPGIYLRGRSGVLIVVDGVPVNSDSWNLSPDDIETYSVLKGASAAALYGNRGQNGAIVISTKKGAGNDKGFKVEFNSSTQVQTGYNAIPEIQTEYGAGDNFKYAFKDGRGGGTNDNDYFIWGPRFEGQAITQYNSPTDDAGNLVPIPWEARGKNNLQSFLRDGLLSTNNIAISTSSDLGDVRLSVSQLFQSGTVPNTKLSSTNFNIGGGLNAGKKLRFDANINYNKQATPNYPSLGYGPQNFIYLLSLWGGADYDVNDLKNYWQPGKENIQQYNREYTIYNNPWLVANENLRSYYKDDLYGHVQMNYKLNNKITFNLRTNVSTWNRNRSIQSPLSGNFYNEGVNLVGGYQETYDTFWENNTEASLRYENRFFNDFGFRSSLYGNLRTVNIKSLSGATTAGLIVPGIYDLSNSALPRSPTNDRAQRQVGSVYGFTDIDYKDFLYLSLTGRFDRSSTIPLNNNTYFYPSASLSAVLSEVINFPKAVSFIKIRGAYANVASDLVDENNQYDIYKLLPQYNTYGTRWNNNTGVGYTGTLFNANILAARVKTAEVGLEARFLKGRAGFDVALFRNTEGPGIVNVPTSVTSGVTGIQNNAYTYIRNGIELTVDGTPVKSANFSWNVLANWSTNHRRLDKIDGVQNRDGNIKVGDRADGYFIADFQRDDEGNMIVGTNGLPAYNPYQTRLGYSDNDFVAGIYNTLNFKSVSLGFQVDGRFGGLINNYVDANQWNGGTHPTSASEYRLQDWNNRNNPGWKGSVMTEGLKIVRGQLNTDQDGNVISDTREFAPNDVPVLWQTWGRNYYRSGDELARSRTFVKLREVVLSYNIPTKFLQRAKFLNTASVSLVGRNLLYFTGKGTRNLDLDQFIGGASFQTPSVKSFGLNLNVTF